MSASVLWAPARGHARPGLVGMFDTVLMSHGMHSVAQGDLAEVSVVDHGQVPAVWLM